MITKGIVEELKGYQAKVRLPIYDGLANTKNATANENLSYATVCITTNLNNSLNVGDIVYVSFEDNDKGKPVILGQLYKEEMNTLADIKLNSANINQLTINKNVSLPQNTSIGSISSKEIAALSGVKDNIQNQIDNNLPAIQFALEQYNKQKNLLDKTRFKTGCYLFANGSLDVNNTNYKTIDPISVKAGSTITVSCQGFTFTNESGFVFFKDGVFVSSVNFGITTTTVPANANQVIYNFFKVGITEDDVQYAQLEYGSIATDYQQYQGGEFVQEGQITPDLIYDINTKNVINGTAYTNGLLNDTSYPIDFNKYEKISVNIGYYNIRTCIFIDFTTPAEADGLWHYPTDIWAFSPNTIVRIELVGNKNSIKVVGTRVDANETLLDAEIARILRIEGIK